MLLNEYLLIPVGLTVAGGLLNLIVKLVNRGRMPVALELRSYPDLQLNYVTMSTKTRLNFLGDWIRVGRVYASPGDVCVDLAICYFWWAALFW